MLKKALFLMMINSFTVMADGNVQAGQQKAAQCRACHGEKGKAGTSIYPHLAGQHAAYLRHALDAYQKGERHGGQAEVMKAFVANLSDQDKDDLAAWYASLKP